MTDTINQGFTAMTDKLNRVWVRDHPYEPDWTADPDLVTKAHVEHVRRSDYDALVAKLSEVEAERDEWHKECMAQNKALFAANDRAEAAETALTAARAALVTAYRLALSDAEKAVAYHYNSVKPHEPDDHCPADPVSQGYGNACFNIGFTLNVTPAPTADALLARIAQEKTNE